MVEHQQVEYTKGNRPGACKSIKGRLFPIMASVGLADAQRQPAHSSLITTQRLQRHQALSSTALLKPATASTNSLQPDRSLIHTMDPGSCGCVVSSDGRLYQPVTCDACQGSMRTYCPVPDFSCPRKNWHSLPSRQCGQCGNRGTMLSPCPHRRSTGAQYAGSLSSQSSQASSS